MKTVGIVGSPKRAGNTSKIVEKILDGAKENGSETQMFVLGEMDINPCNACMGCKETGRCVVQDDMQKVYDALEASDKIVIGSPIYFDHMTAQTKILIDRLYPYYFVKKLEGKDSAIIITYEYNRPNVYDHVIEYLQSRLQTYQNINPIASLKAYDTIKNPVRNRPEILEKAYRLGQELANP